MGLRLRLASDFNHSSACCLKLIVLVDSVKNRVELIPSFSMCSAHLRSAMERVRHTPRQMTIRRWSWQPWVRPGRRRVVFSFPPVAFLAHGKFARKIFPIKTRPTVLPKLPILEGI